MTTPHSLCRGKVKITITQDKKWVKTIGNVNGPIDRKFCLLDIHAIRFHLYG